MDVVLIRHDQDGMRTVQPHNLQNVATKLVQAEATLPEEGDLVGVSPAATHAAYINDADTSSWCALTYAASFSGLLGALEGFNCTRFETLTVYLTVLSWRGFL